MTLFKILCEHLNSLLHPSVRGDAMASAHHRAFIALRMGGGLAALGGMPAYLAVRGAPSMIEVMILAWFISPILISYFLSRTGRFEVAQILSSVSLAALVFAVSVQTGGISSFAAVWLIAVPLEAALSASRRMVTAAVALALGCALALVILEAMNALPPSHLPDGVASLFTGLCIALATIYAAGLAFGAESLARTSKHLLALEERRYRLLARNISDVIARHRANGDLNFISPAVELLLGVPGAALLQNGLFDRVHVADRPRYLTALSDAARGGEASSVEFRIRRESPLGAQFVWVEMRCRPLEQAQDQASGAFEVVSVMRDVTERKAQEQALEAARQEAEQAGASKSRFLATMSHELRTPLNAIIGFSEMIAREDEMKLDAAHRREYAGLINESGLHLLSVVNGILDMSKMESGKFELVSEPFAPREALSGCCNLMALKARDNGIDLVTRMPGDLPQMTGDERAFKQILLNLLSNAIKFTGEGGKVIVSAQVDGRELLLHITDTGIGIGKDDLACLGNPFFQAGASYQGRHEGTGLGLSIVKSLVSLHGGEMKVESELDRGTTVSVRLPMVFAPAAKPSNITTLAPALRADANVTLVKKIA